MELQELKHIAGNVKTPAFIYDMRALAARVRNIKQILGDTIDLCFSIKANPLMTKYLAPMVDYLEVCSPGELFICKAYEVPPEKIILSGVNKTEADIREAYTYGVTLYTSESMHQTELLSRLAEQEHTKLNVLLRASSGTQFGMSTADLKETLRHPVWSETLKFVGIHYFAGTQRKKAGCVKQDLEFLESLEQELRQECGADISRMEYGPGLPVPYFADDDFSDTLAPLKTAAPDLQEFGEKWHLTVEMGRFIAAECGTYCTRIADIKKNPPINYAVLDGGIHHLNYYGQTMAMRVPVITHLRGNGGALPQEAYMPESDVPKSHAPEPTHWLLCGSLCTTADILVRDVELSEPAIGDMLAFHHAGAYSNTEGIYLFLSRAMPYVYLYGEDGVLTLLRDMKETYVLNMED